MITVQDAQIYSTKKEMAYQITYSNGTTVRAVESSNKIIRTEYIKNGAWFSNKAYVVKSSGKRNAEMLKKSAINFLND